MSDNYCAICDCKLFIKEPLVWFCSKCYKEWNTEILNKKPWVIYLRNLEDARRYRRQVMGELNVTVIYLGLEYDIDDIGRLVRRNING